MPHPTPPPTSRPGVAARLASPWTGLRGLPREVWALCGATLVNRMGTMALPFLVLYLTDARGLGAGTAGAVLAAFGVGSAAAAPLGGWLSDRIGALRVVRASLLLSGLLLLAVPLAHGLPAIVAVVLAWAVMAETVRPASMTVLADAVPPEMHRRAFALMRLAVNLGMSVGPAVGGLLATISFPLLFVVDGATSLVAAVVLTVALRGVASAPADDGGGAPRLAAGVVLRDRRFAAFLAANFVVGLVFFQNLGPLPVHVAQGMELGEASVGFVFTINTLLIVALEVPLNAWTSRWSHRASLAAGALLTGAGFGAVGLAGGFVGIAGATVVWTFGEMVLFPATSAWAAEHAPAGRRGEYMGAFALSFSLAFAVGPGLGTWALARFGPGVVWPGTALLSLLAAALLARVAGPPSSPPVSAAAEP